MFEKVLVANRGAVAARVIRALGALGLRAVAVYSEADADAPYLDEADEAHLIGPAPPKESYLNQDAILKVLAHSGADAVHPGYGFLAENPNFALRVEGEGAVFIGPSAKFIEEMGHKTSARDLVGRHGMSVMRGSEVLPADPEKVVVEARRIGFPVLIKPAAGGGGIGMIVARDRDELLAALERARSMAHRSFANDEIYLEKLLERPRHIEFQVLGDRTGVVRHLFERDCSIQRRHQKVIEEAPSPALNPAQRAAIGQRVVEAVGKLNYRGAGTIEFLYEDGDFHFIEMNTRLQVEHPISEMISGVDLVREQIRIAAGEPLSLSQSDIVLSGHAMECRVVAENPETFAPSPGKVTDYHAPGGLGVRVDSALYSGYAVPPHYDSLVSKLIVHADSREDCIMRLRRALDEYVIGGIETTIPLHQRLLLEQDFRNGDYDIHWLESFLGL